MADAVSALGGECRNRVALGASERQGGVPFTPGLSRSPIEGPKVAQWLICSVVHWLIAQYQPWSSQKLWAAQGDP